MSTLAAAAILRVVWFIQRCASSLLLGLVAARGTLPSSCDRNATVAPYDTCNTISAMHNVSTYQLAAVNSGIINSKCDNLQVGGVVCLGLGGQDCQTTYVVQVGDTCASIANAHSISERVLLQNNPNVNWDCTNIYPREVLCVSDAIHVDLTRPNKLSAMSANERIQSVVESGFW